MEGIDVHDSNTPAERPALDLATVVGALPFAARFATVSAWRLSRWALSTTTATTTQLVRAVVAGEPPSQVVADTTASLRAIARGLLGIPADGPAANGANPHANGAHPAVVPPTEWALRQRGEALLRDSADVWRTDDTHPAYARILDELSPDEARVLRLLALEGPQPAIDIRTNRPLGVGSELVASGLSMIGLQAGVRNVARTNAHLNNLNRLGLVWFSREQVADPTRYQVVEVQPEVLEAMKRAGRSPKVVHRSIHLTPFGEDFCAVCLPLP